MIRWIPVLLIVALVGVASAQQAAPPAPAQAPAAAEKMAEGKVKSVDQAKKQVTLEDGTMFTIPATVQLPADLKPGSTVAISYVEAGLEIPDTEFPKAQRLAFEKEMLGLYVSEHPLMGAERSLKRHVDSTLSELREAREGELRTVGGIVTALATKYTRRGDFMATFVLEDLAGVLDVMVFPRTMTEYGHVLENDAIVVVKGRVDLRDDAPKLVAMEVIRPEIVLEGGPPVRIKVKLNALSDDKAARLKGILAEHPGDSAVYVHLEAPEKTTVLRLGDDVLVDAGNGLFAELRVLLGADCIA